MSDQKVLSERIAELCRQKRMSFYLLSYHSAVPITTIMNIINCTTKNPGVFTIIKLCDGLGITVKEFFDTKEFENIESKTE